MPESVRNKGKTSGQRAAVALWFLHGNKESDWLWNPRTHRKRLVEELGKMDSDVSELKSV